MSGSFVKSPQMQATWVWNGNFITKFPEDGWSNIMASNFAVGESWSAARFTDINIPMGSTVLEANLVFTDSYDDYAEYDWGYLFIGAFYTDDVPVFTLPYSSTPTTAMLRVDYYHQPPLTLSVKQATQAVLNREGWAPGNSMGFVLRAGSGFYPNFNFPFMELHMSWEPPPPPGPQMKLANGTWKQLGASSVKQANNTWKKLGQTIPL